VRVVRKIPADFKDAFEAAVGALRRLGKIDVAIDAVAKVTMPHKFNRFFVAAITLF
jgi:hypothetical protein